MERRLAGPWRRMVRYKAMLLARAGGHPPGARTRRPTPESWSLAEVVEHLVLVEQGVTGALAKAPDPERPRSFGWDRGIRFAVLRVVLIGGIRVKVPVPRVLPSGEPPWHALLSRWEGERRTLEEWLRSVDPAVIPTPRFRHPVVGWLDVHETLTFAADHLRHHLGQVERIERHLR